MYFYSIEFILYSHLHSAPIFSILNLSRSFLVYKFPLYVELSYQTNILLLIFLLLLFFLYIHHQPFLFLLGLLLFLLCFLFYCAQIFGIFQFAFIINVNCKTVLSILSSRCFFLCWLLFYCYLQQTKIFYSPSSEWEVPKIFLSCPLVDKHRRQFLTETKQIVSTDPCLNSSACLASCHTQVFHQGKRWFFRRKKGQFQSNLLASLICPPVKGSNESTACRIHCFS